MTPSHTVPNEKIASAVAATMTNEKVLSSTRMTTGDQYFVFAIKTENSEYVIRMTDNNHKKKFISAVYWQEKLLPLGIPLAEFIKTDLEGMYSEFPALLMLRLPGNDLINVYSKLTDSDKKNLADKIAKIQATVATLPEGPGYGMAESYEQILDDRSWYDFLIKGLHSFKNSTKSYFRCNPSHERYFYCKRHAK